VFVINFCCYNLVVLFVHTDQDLNFVTSGGSSGIGPVYNGVPRSSILSNHQSSLINQVVIPASSDGHWLGRVNCLLDISPSAVDISCCVP